MNHISCLIPFCGALLLSGCAGTNSDFECTATTSDTCMTMEQANVSKKHNTPGEYKFSKVIWYIIMPICSLISPMLSLMIFIFGTLCDLRKVSNCISIKDWMKTQVAVEESDNHVSLDFESVEFSRSNPATGLPMSGIGVDIGGNSYGYSSSHHYR
ncbi:type IV conjugative transfer system lipoprotein TraV [Salmonella enterica]|nr:type IV conjugative transfer system lipoprotein TraV [Salmonella enterica]